MAMTITLSNGYSFDADNIVDKDYNEKEQLIISIVDFKGKLKELRSNIIASNIDDIIVETENRILRYKGFNATYGVQRVFENNKDTTSIVLTVNNIDDEVEILSEAK